VHRPVEPEREVVLQEAEQLVDIVIELILIARARRAT
jgi:hypothetical protein